MFLLHNHALLFPWTLAKIVVYNGIYMGKYPLFLDNSLKSLLFLERTRGYERNFECP